MLNVTKKQIQDLKDDDFRELLALLSISTLNKYKINSKSVSYGGNQDAKDGGVDIRIKFKKIPPENDFIDNKNIIIQVKVPNMTASEIKKEMCPNNSLRESIKELETCNGKYIIASSKADLTDLEYSKRIDSMKNCIKDYKNIKIDFYDCNKIATWVNEHPGTCMWVHNKNSLNVFGWQSFFEWEKSYQNFSKEFITDDNSFIFKESYQDKNKTSLIDAVNEIRKILSTPKKVVRIAGLSGTGKTRLAFSLFDNKFGKNALNSELLLYCDIGDNPTPDPVEMMQYYIKNNKRVIMIVDNCEKDSHVSLSKYCQMPNSLVSLLTIEYDAKEDDVIDVNNYYMASSSDNIIRKFLEINFKSIHSANIETIVKCSGGNFRLAKYLAMTIDKNDTIGILNSDELFNRLFINKNKTNYNLLKTAEICSLLFSFNINTELEVLSKLTDISEKELYENVNILQEMQLVQSRGDMRAILPHALANKLASDCLKKIRTDDILKVLENGDRMFMSFSRRLKFLHVSQEAKKIACKILKLPNFNDLTNISNSNIEILKNLCFIVPDKVLNKIICITDSRFFSRENKNYNVIVDILIFLAYYSEQFEIVIQLLIKFACSENKDENINSIRHRLYNLFHLYLSGTHASIDQRINVVNSLIGNSNAEKNDLGLTLLDELLQTSNFFGNCLDFGSQKRDYGYQPKNGKDIKEWYENTLGLCELKIKNNICKDEIKDIIANNFKGLMRTGMIDKLESIIKYVLQNETWPEIWIAIKSLKHFDKNEIPVKILERINKLEENTFPQSLEDEFKIYVKSKSRLYLTADDITEDWENLNKIAFEIGKNMGKNMEIFISHFELIVSEKNYRDFSFGKGIAYNNDNINEILNYLFENLSEDQINININLLSGIIFEVSNNKEKVNKILDNVLDNKKIKKIYPSLQGSYDVNDEDIDRIIKSLSDNEIPLARYTSITYRLKNVSNEKIICYMKAIPNSLEGLELKIDVLYYLFKERDKKVETNVLDIAAQTMSIYPFNKDFSKRSHINYEFSEVIKMTFTSNKYSAYAKKIFTNIKKEVEKDYISFYDFEDILKNLINNYSVEFLDTFVINFDSIPNLRWFLSSSFSNKPLVYIDDEVLIKWIKENNKYIEILSLIEPFYKDSYDNEYKWSKLGYFYINYAEEKSDIEIIENLIETIYPDSWDETLPEILNERISLINYIIKNTNEEFSELASNERIKLIGRINSERENFRKHRHDQFNSFE